MRHRKDETRLLRRQSLLAMTGERRGTQIVARLMDARLTIFFVTARSKVTW